MMQLYIISVVISFILISIVSCYINKKKYDKFKIGIIGIFIVLYTSLIPILNIIILIGMIYGVIDVKIEERS